MIINNLFEIRQYVWRRLNGEQKGQVTGLIVRDGFFWYLVTWSDGREDTLQEFELSDEPYYEGVPRED